VSTALVGASVGGWMNDKLGIKITLFFADVLFFAGSVIMAASPNPAVLLVGRVFVGIDIGMASMTSLYKLSTTKYVTAYTKIV
jgi:SP family myo-inositol transporter-like MFS transporter 13